jgi:ANTAR domain
LSDGIVDRGDDPRDEQIAQLERALESRVVIEQAKGIMFERFGLSMGDSFELLRQAARSHRLKVRDLAARLVDTRETPAAITDALVNIGHAYPDDFAARAALTENLFAELNDSLLASNRSAGWTEFICECANPLCEDVISVTPETLERIHSHPRHYVVKVGHEIDAVETVIERFDDLLIVEKPVT